MKLYISYYENYVVIVEGMYNNKKGKYIIKNLDIITENDVVLDTEDRYSLLRQALELNQYKSKKVVFLLNTRDVILKSNSIKKIDKKDLDGIMNNEMYDMMSLDDAEYSFSYEVIGEREVEEEIYLDMIIAAVQNRELDEILQIFEENKLTVTSIDTLTTAYSRLIKNIEYNDMMIINIGRYGSIVDIYKENTFFIHDNIPVKVSDESNEFVAQSLKSEIKGLMDFYSSRNFGKEVDEIILIGESNKNKFIQEEFRTGFNSKVITGVENLFNIADNIQGEILEEDISNITDILGSMLISTMSKKSYDPINLLPLEEKNKRIKNIKNRNILSMTIASVSILALPYCALIVMNNRVEDTYLIYQQNLNNIKVQYKSIKDLDTEIQKYQDKIDIYEMLSSKNITWNEVLSAIEKNISTNADLTDVKVYYDEYLAKTTTVKETTEDSSDTTQQTSSTSTPLYEKIPNTISLTGITRNAESIGMFTYNLNQLDYFKSVELKSSIWDENDDILTFEIILILKEGVISVE